MSAAGSGKTYSICKEALDAARLGKRILITTYTNRGVDSVKNEIRKQNDGVLNPLIVIKTWFTFMMTDMIKPYQRYITGEISGIKTFDYSQTYGFVNYAKVGTKEKYITRGKNVRSNEASSLVCLLNRLSGGKVISRLEEVYKAIFFDEIQDLAGDDIEILRLLLNSSIDIICCGDNKQATFCTHNTKKNKRKTGKNIWDFFKEFGDSGLIEVERNLVSRRFNDQICCFANTVFPIGNPISTNMMEETGHDGVFLISAANVDVYYKAFTPQMLRYDKRAETYGYLAVNYGACKGETFERVVIIPNGPFKKFITKGIALEVPEKYYVAVTRAKYSVAIIMEKLPTTLRGFKGVQIECGEAKINALQYIVDEESHGVLSEDPLSSASPSHFQV